MTSGWQHEVCSRNASPAPLSSFERRVTSQNGEDGILEEIFRRVGTTNGYLVEIGSADGEENCTRQLVESGWSGLWIEADPVRAARAREVADGRVTVIAAAASPEQIPAMLHASGVPEGPDLVVVDIDGADWWVLNAVLSRFAPRVLVAEYNATFPPSSSWIQRYRPNRVWDGTFRHGASLSAISTLARAHDLLLVGCDSSGVNAFFVADSEIDQVSFGRPGDVESHYVGPWFAPGLWGHPRSADATRPMLALAPDDVARVTYGQIRREGSVASVTTGEPVAFSVLIDNQSTAALSSGAPAPVHLALRWLEAGGPAPAWEAEARVSLSRRVRAGRRDRQTFWRRAPATPGTYRLETALVQEGVAWFAHADASDRSPGVEVLVRREPSP